MHEISRSDGKPIIGNTHCDSAARTPFTIKELRSYRAICAEIAAIDKKLSGSRIHVKDSVPSAAKHPYSLHSVSVEGDIYEHSSPYLLAKKQRLIAEKQSIENFVEGIESTRIRDAVEIYCIEPVGENCEPPDWNDVADRFADGSTGDSLRMAVRRFLEKI